MLIHAFTSRTNIYITLTTKIIADINKKKCNFEV